MIDNKEAFEALVVSEVKGLASKEQSDLLRSPEMLDSWRRVLIQKKIDVETQLTTRGAYSESYQNECHAKGSEGKTAWFNHLAEHKKWRATALNFKKSLEKRLNEVKLLQSQVGGDHKYQLKDALDRLDAIQMLVIKLCKHLGISIEDELVEEEEVEVPGGDLGP